MVKIAGKAKTGAKMVTAKVPGAIGTSEAARLLGITVRWVNKLAGDGSIPQIARGKFDPCEIVRAYIDFKVAAVQRPTTSSSLDALRASKMRREELRIAEEERRLMNTDEVFEMVDYQASIYLDSLSRLSGAITSDVRERQRVDLIIDQERQRVADRFVKAGSAFREGRPVDETEAED